MKIGCEWVNEREREKQGKDAEEAKRVAVLLWHLSVLASCTFRFALAIRQAGIGGWVLDLTHPVIFFCFQSTGTTHGALQQRALCAALHSGSHTLSGTAQAHTQRHTHTHTHTQTHTHR